MLTLLLPYSRQTPTVLTVYDAGWNPDSRWRLGARDESLDSPKIGFHFTIATRLAFETTQPRIQKVSEDISAGGT
jgi:hypothetical protein